MLTNRNNILEANKEGFQEPDHFGGGYLTPVLSLAYQLGQQGIDLEPCPDEIGIRYGDLPESGLSWNWKDDKSERGLSLARLKGGVNVPSYIWFSERSEVEVPGLLLPYKGSDGEYLLLPYSLPVLD
jgi:hypothetical protein